MTPRLRNLFPLLTSAIAAGGLLCGVQPALAVQLQATGPVCMQTLYGAANGGKSLGCTANDVRIAKATNASPTSCIAGSTFDLTATFQVELSSTARYDVGLYFDTAGDPEKDGALTGTCVVTALPTTTPGTQLDTGASATPDTCGDIDSAHSPMFVTATLPGVSCTDNGQGKLLLPNCVSWRQPGSNDLCNAATDAFPGAPSKCKCDKAFSVDVAVESPSLTVTKAANPSSLNEPGGSVTYTVTVTNAAQNTSVTLSTIVDDPDNDPATSNSITYQASQICGKTTLGPSPDSTTCTFTHAVSGNQNDLITDKACVNGTGYNNAAVQKCATATVTINGVAPSGAATKEAISAVVTFQLQVKNTSIAEPATLKALCDDKYGAIKTAGTATCPAGTLGSVISTDCDLGTQGKTLAINGQSGDFYSCTFEAAVPIDGLAHTDKATGTLSDNDGNSISSAEGTATVTITTSHNP
jgi:hypothetical protein